MMREITNTQVADALYEISEILELLEKDQFRVIAYQNASQAIKFLPQPIQEVIAEGKLLDIKGIGEGIGKKIEELVKIGKLRYLERIRKQVAPQELELMRVPGVGPKTARAIYKKVRFKTLNDLARLLKRDRAKQKKFTPKALENLQRGIADYRSHSGRMLLRDAIVLAEEVLERVKEVPELEQIEPAGSLRRGLETVGDLDFVAATGKPAALIEAFRKLPLVKRVILEGEVKCSVMTTRGIRMDLEIVQKDQFGNLLQHFTGSKEHNVALRTWAEKHGYSISEHGIKQENKVYTSETEEGVYRTLKMQLPPPELREDQGEIEAALGHRLPHLVALSDIRADLHTHTDHSDGKPTLLELVRAAKARHYDYLAVTDHSAGLGVTHGLSGRALVGRQGALEKVQSQIGGIRVLLGVEVSIRPDGELDMEDQYLEAVDLVVASIHSSFYQESDTVTQRLLRALENPHVDILGHPSGRLIDQRRPVDPDWEAVFKAAARHKVALEINASPQRLDLNDTHILLAKKFGCKFVISTDTHQLEHLDFMRYGVLQARRGWCTEEDILNTRPLNELLRWFR